MSKEYLLILTKSVLSSLARAKLRSFLTSLGILIGVLAVVLLMSLGVGVKSYIQQEFESLGSNTVFVTIGNIQAGGFGRGLISNFRFKMRDVKALRKIDRVEFVVPVYLQPNLKIAYRKNVYVGDLILSTPEILEAHAQKIFVGRDLNKEDFRRKAKVAVIAWKVAEELFDSPAQALGKYITVEGVRLKVIGVAEEKGGLGAPDYDNNVYAPYTSLPHLNPQNNFTFIYLKAFSEKDVDYIQYQAKRVLKRWYDEDKFSVIKPSELLNTFLGILRILNLALVGIAGISLLVGGIGIMNVMYMSVAERTKEIGIRRAVGATKRDILAQFLIEGLSLSIFGGVLGLIISLGLVEVIKKFIPAKVDFGVVLMAFGVSALVGVLFSIFPAKKASELSPIEAIRYE